MLSSDAKLCTGELSLSWVLGADSRNQCFANGQRAQIVWAVVEKRLQRMCLEKYLNEGHKS